MNKCLHLTEIPEKYKDSEKYRVFKRGATSIVIEDLNSSDKLLMFTRDYFKAEYYIHILDFKYIDSYFSREHPIRELHNYLINIIEVPRLEKISRKEHNQIFKSVYPIIDKNLLFNKDTENVHKQTIVKLMDELGEDHLLYDYLTYLSNYSDWRFDIKTDSILKHSITQERFVIDLTIPKFLLELNHDYT